MKHKNFFNCKAQFSFIRTKSKIMLLKLTIFAILLTLLPAAAYTDNDIFRQLALSGNVLAVPYEINSRIVAITDGGFISTFSTDGYRKYERPLKNRPSGDYTVTGNGMILSVSHDRKTVSFYNPDGYFVWSHTFDDDITNYPVAGYDGRIFISTKKAVYCFGVTGCLRWERTVSKEINEPIRTLNDGTLLCICCQQGKESLAYRFTPFGDLIEEITFAGEVVLTEEHENGVLMLFSDGTFGCCSVQDRMAVSLWASLVVHNMHISRGNTNTASILRLDANSVAVLYPNGLAVIFNTADGKEKCRMSVSSGFNKGFLFSGDGNIMSVTEYDTEVVFSLFSLEGEPVWNGLRKKEENTVYFYTSDGYLLQFTDNWLLSVSRPIKQLSEKKTSYNGIKHPHLYGTYTGNAEEQHIREIKVGFDEIMEELLPVSNPTIYTGIDPSLFQKDLITTLQCIQDAVLTGYDFSIEIGRIITNATSELYLKTALDYPIRNGYDPDANMLKAIFTFISSPHTFSCSDTIYKKMCDAVSSISRFSGSDIFQNYGSRILVKFMSSGYSTSVKGYAVNIMKSLMELQISNLSLKVFRLCYNSLLQ